MTRSAPAEVNIDDDDSFAAHAGDAVGRGELDLGDTRRIATLLRRLSRSNVLLTRELAERHADGLLTGLPKDAEVDGRSRDGRVDHLDQVATVLDRLTVHRGDDIGGADAGLAGGAARMRL